MFVPLNDKNPLKYIRLQYVTLGLIAINVLVFFLFQPSVDERTMASFALVPAEYMAEGFFGPVIPNQHYDAYPLPESYTLFSYMFLHGSTMHLIGNMLFLWVFGDNVEDALGHFRFLIFYLVAGALAGYAHALFVPASAIPLVGASGAIAGVIAGYLLLHPKVNLMVLMMGLPMNITAGVAILLWAGFQVFQGFFSSGDNIAWWAHVGGFAAGLVLLLLLRPRGTPLLDGMLQGRNDRNYS